MGFNWNYFSEFFFSLAVESSDMTDLWKHFCCKYLVWICCFSTPDETSLPWFVAGAAAVTISFTRWMGSGEGLVEKEHAHPCPPRSYNYRWVRFWVKCAESQWHETSRECGRLHNSKLLLHFNASLIEIIFLRYENGPRQYVDKYARPYPGTRLMLTPVLMHSFLL